MGEERLKRLIMHWIEHNEEHKARFEGSAREAKAMGLEAVAEALGLAAGKASEVSQQLRKALEAFK